MSIANLIGIEKIATFLVMLSVLVVLHELGHFLVARRNGVRVNEFAVGMGPKLLGWTSPRSGTLYSVRALPIGGYCAMQGEDGKTSEAEQQREFRTAHRIEDDNFQAKSAWQRLIIVLAGPLANFVLCYCILLLGALLFGIAGSDTQPVQPVVGILLHGSPAAIAGLQPGDRIVALNGVAVTSGGKLVDTIHASLGKKLDLVYQRNGARTEVFVTPTLCPIAGKKFGCIGFSPVPTYQRVGFAEALRQSGLQFRNIADQTVGSIVLLVTHFTKYAPQISGVIGMGQVAATVEDWGWGPYLWLAATISFALGLFNLLPIPALDGGRAAFIVAELIRGKPVDPEKEAMVHIAGFAALMALMLLVAFHDIARIASGNGVM
ncbi:MAG: site-2 protease family protein [Candidatus Eremiobacteraeota bacterium]|nr:site-2 protease family protein [Candidatus Eremiobacteraeota bacterium]